jgi:hypothetical protein
MKAHHNRHHFAQTYPLRSPPLAALCGYQVPLPQGLKLQTEAVNVTEQRYNLHNENPLGHEVLVALTTVLKRFLVAYSFCGAQCIDFVKKLRRTQV